MEGKGKFQFSFGAKDPFKYDSTDDEGDDEKTNEKNTLPTSDSAEIPGQKDDRLFFTHNDPRFRGK